MFVFTDDKMGENGYIQCGWRNSPAGRFSDVGNNIPTHKKKDVRALLLHSSSIHCLCSVFCASCWHLLFLHYAPWFLSLHDRSIFEVSAISSKYPFTLNSNSSMPNCRTQLLQKQRCINIYTHTYIYISTIITKSIDLIRNK